MNRMKRYQARDVFWGFLMILPLVIGLGVFYIYPVGRVFWDSLHHVGAFGKTSWAGLDNYQRMFQDEATWSTLANTLKYVVIIVPLTTIISLILAALLNTGVKGQSFFRVIYFIPAVTMSAAVAMVWKWMYNGDFGIINNVITSFGGEKVNFLTDKSTVLPSIAVVSIWMGVGYNMMILLAGIQGISKSYYEAAAIDGATKVQQFFKVTLPLVTPTLFFVVVTMLISTFQTFDIIYMMIPPTGRAMDAAQSMVVYFYKNAFEFSQKGYASALAVFLFVIIMIITAIQMKLQEKWVTYD